ncbi:MAG: glycosyltransferase family 8 protein [Ferruginibacter sp.]|nr:glycosyltransferase family 8 protein [Ferruginibacter sp.]
MGNIIKTNKKLNIFFTIDEKFIVYFTVTLTSLLENNKDLDTNIFVIYSFKNSEPLEKIALLAKENYNTTINLIYKDSSTFAHYTISKHVSISTYLRLLLPDILPKEIETGLFLDADTIVTGSLIELANLNFTALEADYNSKSNKYLYAVSEVNEYVESESRRITALGYPTDRYFNAGIMFINVKNWRLINATDNFLAIASANMNSLLYWDQDVLNMFFANQWTALDQKFNALHLIWKQPTTPTIIHFVGMPKPWNYLCRHPYRNLYFKYLSKTPFKSKRYTDFDYKKMPYKYYKDLLHFLNYFRQLFLGNLKL